MDKEHIIKTINNLLIQELKLRRKRSPQMPVLRYLGLESLDFVDIAVFVKKNSDNGERKGKWPPSNCGDLYDYISNYDQKK